MFWFFLENRQRIGFLVNTTKYRTCSLIRCTWKGTKAKYWLVLLLYIIQKSAYLAGLWWHIVKQTVKYQFKFKSIFATKFLEGAAYSTVFWKRLILKSVYLFNVTFLNVPLIHHLQWKTLVFKLVLILINAAIHLIWTIICWSMIAKIDLNGACNISWYIQCSIEVLLWIQLIP